jgi:hypothetical protein
MPENDHLNGFLNEIELGFVEREVTPRLLMSSVFSSIWLACHFEYRFYSWDIRCQSSSIHHPQLGSQGRATA